MRRSLALMATLSMLALAPALAQQTTPPPAPAQISPRLMPRGPGTANSTTTPATTGAMSMSRRPMAPPAPSGQLVNINTASASDLDALPQIGPARLKKIIAGRPYTSTQDLVTKHVLSQHVYDTIKDRITVR